MKTLILISTFILFLCGTSLFSQSTFEDAKFLAAFRQLYELNQDKVTPLKFDLSDSVAQESLAKLVLQWKNRGLGAQTHTDSRGAVTMGGGIPQGNAGQPLTPIGNPNLNTSVLQKIQKEIEWYIAFAKTGDTIFDGTQKIDSILMEFPESFEYLKTTIRVLENGIVTGSFTASDGLGSIVSISQAEILKGITDWALDRAQKELMQAFLKNWLEQLNGNLVLQEIFPSTLNMLSTRSVTTFFTDGDTWKATFQQDFDRLPAHIPEIADIALREAGEPIPLEDKKELISGLAMTVALFEAIGNNKRPEEVFQLISQEAFLRVKEEGIDKGAIIDRTVMAVGTFISSLQVKRGETLSFVNPSEVLAMSQPEMKTFWKLLFLREAQKLTYTFELRDDAKRAQFYNSIRDEHLPRVQLQLSQIAESIQGINTLVNKIKASQNQSFTKEAFHTYVTLTFELLEMGIQNLEQLGVATLDTASIIQYKEKYLSGYRQVAQIIEGVKTKQYGQVTLNTVNLLLWIKEWSTKEKIVGAINIEEYVSQVTGDINSTNLEILAGALLAVTKRRLSIFPESKKLVDSKLAQFKSALKGMGGTIPKEQVLELLRSNLQLTLDEQRVVLKEVASGVIALGTTSEAVHRYGNLMVNIVMAEDSEDVENALEVAAMETGGYLVKQNSTFSTTVSFFPGIEYGWEQIDSVGGQEGDGSFIGATLPIGVEFAWGTGWEKTIGAVGIFVQVLDLGAVLNYSLQNDNDDLENRTDFGFREVLSPGSYLLLHAKNVPITFGAGVSYSPSLRKIGMEDATIDANAFQFGIFAGVDLNVFTLFGSDSKISSKPRSKRQR